MKATASYDSRENHRIFVQRNDDEARRSSDFTDNQRKRGYKLAPAASIFVRYFGPFSETRVHLFPENNTNLAPTVHARMYARKSFAEHKARD